MNLTNVFMKSCIYILIDCLYNCIVKKLKVYIYIYTHKLYVYNRYLYISPMDFLLKKINYDFLFKYKYVISLTLQAHYNNKSNVI